MKRLIDFYKFKREIGFVFLSRYEIWARKGITIYSVHFCDYNRDYADEMNGTMIYSVFKTDLPNWARKAIEKCF